MVVDTSWRIKTGQEESTTITFGEPVADSMSIEDGWPDFTVGREISFSLLFEANNSESYNRMLLYGQYLFDGAVEFGTDYREQPYYKERLNPNFRSLFLDDLSGGLPTFLFELVPADRIDNVEGWWVVVSDIQEASLYDGPWGRVDFTAFVLAPSTEGDREYIERQYEVN